MRVSWRHALVFMMVSAGLGAGIYVVGCSSDGSGVGEVKQKVTLNQSCPCTTDPSVRALLTDSSGNLLGGEVKCIHDDTDPTLCFWKPDCSDYQNCSSPVAANGCTNVTTGKSYCCVNHVLFDETSAFCPVSDASVTDSATDAVADSVTDSTADADDGASDALADSVSDATDAADATDAVVDDGDAADVSTDADATTDSITDADDGASDAVTDSVADSVADADDGASDALADSVSDATDAADATDAVVDDGDAADATVTDSTVTDATVDSVADATDATADTFFVPDGSVCTATLPAAPTTGFQVAWVSPAGYVQSGPVEVQGNDPTQSTWCPVGSASFPFCGGTPAPYCTMTSTDGCLYMCTFSKPVLSGFPVTINLPYARTGCAPNNASWVFDYSNDLCGGHGHSFGDVYIGMGGVWNLCSTTAGSVCQVVPGPSGSPYNWAQFTAP